MTIRKLTDNDGVQYTVSLEEEDLEVRGNIIDSGDAEYDRKLEDETIERLSRGELEAWCCVKVVAEWRGFTGVSYLGGCSLSEEYTKDVAADEHGMRAEALERLNEALEDTAERLEDLIRQSAE